jgi:branched-chain amino acid aminotransferase
MTVEAKKLWLDGRMLDWKDGTTHVLTHTLHYGVGVFEGIRCYKTVDGRSAVFRLPEHMRRLRHSAHAVYLKVPYSDEQLSQALLDVLRENDLAEAYIRPLVFLGAGTMGLFPDKNPTQVMIAAWSWGAYLGEEGLKNGIRVRVSSYIRPHVNSFMTKAKVCGGYVNSYLAKMEAKRDGYDEALFLDTEGYVCEASGENVFLVRDGVIKTPTLGAALPGITRDSVMTLARDHGYTVLESRFSRDEVYMADEFFMTGTAAELTPVRELDGRSIGSGKPGPVTKTLQEAYFRAVKGADDKHKDWLTYL